MLAEPGLRIISINSNYCNNMNFYNYVNQTDPSNELAWLVQTLQLAEDNEERVLLLGHIPTGVTDCLQHWSNMFYQIVNRYEDTISAQFYGHTHNDQFQVFYLDENGSKRATSVAYITPSVTTMTDINPSYRIYLMDANTMSIIDHSTFHVNLTRANIEDEPVWELEYVASEAFNMTTIYPEDWANLIDRMETDDSLLQAYFDYFFSQGGPPQGNCTGECVKDLICGMRSASSSLYLQCMVSNESHGFLEDFFARKRSNC